MIPWPAVTWTLLYAATAAAICTDIKKCPQFSYLKTDDCQKYHHFLARGSTSPYPGHAIEMVSKICNALNTTQDTLPCGYEDVQYSAQTGGEKRCISSHEGALNAAAQMKSYNERCPDSNLIFIGYSQGAGVSLDVLGGGGGELWGCKQKDNPGMNISSTPGSKRASPCF